MKLYERAAAAYQEAIYALSPDWIMDKDRRRETLLSPRAVTLWLKVSEAELKAGNIEDAYNHLGLAAVFGSEEQKKIAIHLSKKIKIEQNARNPKPKNSILLI